MHPSLNPCLDVVTRNYDKIVKNLEEIFRIKGLRYKELYVFQSRAVGTCRLDSDLDIYVQLCEEHRQLVEEKGVTFCGIKVLKTPTIMEGISKEHAMTLGAIEPPIYLDITACLAEKPPAKPQYINMRYYVNLRELKPLLP